MCTNEDGHIDRAYLYECEKYPGHYIRWYHEQDTVDCEVPLFYHGYMCIVS